VVKHIGLIVAEVADRIFSKMWVIEGENLQVGQPVEVEHLLEAADLVATDVQIGELN
jgi:hypothetical protein